MEYETTTIGKALKRLLIIQNGRGLKARKVNVLFITGKISNDLTIQQ